MSRVSPNRRAPCGGGTSKPFVAGCFGNQKDKTLNAVKVKRNVTKMKNYVSGSSDWIDPVITVLEDLFYPSCDNRSTEPCNSGPGSQGYEDSNYYCHDILDDSYFQSCAAGAQFQVGPYHNCYEQTNETQSANKCRNIGFKNVYASKTWPGRWSYTSRMNGQVDWGDWAGACSYRNYTPTPDKTKYRTLTATSDYEKVTSHYCQHNCTEDPYSCGTIDCGGGPVENVCYWYTANGTTTDTGYASNTVTVDVHGNIIVGNCYSASSCQPAPLCDGGTPSPCTSYQHEQEFALLGEANYNIANLYQMYLGALLPSTSPDVVTGDGNTWTVTYYGAPYLCYDDDCGTTTHYENWTEYEVEVNLSAGTLSVRRWFLRSKSDLFQSHCTYEASCHTVVLENEDIYTFSGTGYTHTFYSTYDSASLSSETNRTITGNLSTPYTSDQVYAEIVALLGHWDFGDENVYPWRESGRVTEGPYVHYVEGGGRPEVPNCSSSIYYTNQVYGAPAPEGIDRVWDPDHANYCVCSGVCGDTSTGYTHYIQDYGAWSTDIGVPRATSWLNNFDALDTPQGAFVMSGWGFVKGSTCAIGCVQASNDDAMWACKYAEVISPMKSMDYARPCGSDRFSITSSWTGSSGYEYQVNSIKDCVVSVSDMALTFESDGPAQPTLLQTGNKVWVCGLGDLYDGAWSITRDSDYQITLNNPRICSASQIPWAPVDKCGEGLVYKLLWQNFWSPICGRIDITSANNQSPVTCSLMEESWVCSGDMVRVTGAKGLTSINGMWSASVIDNKTIALIGTNGISQSSYIANSGQMYSPWGVDWRWQDTNPKGEFSILKWKYNFRDIGEWQRVSASVPYNDTIYVTPIPPDTEYDTTCPGPSLPPEPRPNQNPCGMWNAYETMTSETSCLPSNPCAPVVAYFSPNKESFVKSGSVIEHARNYGFVNPGLDSGYTTRWQAMVRRSMPDIYYAYPPCPCETDEFGYTDCQASWRMDDGGCSVDVEEPNTKYYRMYDEFESRQEVPPGAPGLIPGYHIGCLQTNDFNARCPDGVVCWAPWQPNCFPIGDTCDPYNVYLWSAPWLTLLAKESCVCNDGQFKDWYERGGIICPDDIVPPP